MDITKLPFNKFIGIGRSQREGFTLSLPSENRYTNHLGTVHASALMALAEATSGEALLNAIGNLGDTIIPVVRRFECKFRKPASGSIDARVSATPRWAGYPFQVTSAGFLASFDLLPDADRVDHVIWPGGTLVLETQVWLTEE